MVGKNASLDFVMKTLSLQIKQVKNLQCTGRRALEAWLRWIKLKARLIFQPVVAQQWQSA